MYLFYQDESFDSGWFFLGASAIHSGRWKGLAKAVSDLKWDAFGEKPPIRRVRIRSHDIRRYGTKDAVWPWTLLSREELDSFVEGFYQLYEQFDITLFFVGIDRKKHQNRYGEKARHCYDYAFENILERLDLFLSPCQANDVGHIFVDEYKEMRRKIRTDFLWYREQGTWVKSSINNFVEPPTFVRSTESDLISLADIATYNVFHAYRYNKPEYPYFNRILPRVYRNPKTGEPWGAGIKIFPDQIEPGL